MLVAPRALFTVITPFCTIQLAGDLSLVFTHSSSFFPSNRTIASEGGADSTAAGVTTFGTGSHTSVSCGLGRVRPCAAGCCAIRLWAANNAATPQREGIS